jgi:hypothetical protein
MGLFSFHLSWGILNFTQYKYIFAKNLVASAWRLKLGLSSNKTKLQAHIIIHKEINIVLMAILVSELENH